MLLFQGDRQQPAALGAARRARVHRWRARIRSQRRRRAATARPAEVRAAGVRRAGRRAAARYAARCASSSSRPATWTRARWRSTGPRACSSPRASSAASLLCCRCWGSARCRCCMAVVWLGGLGWVGPVFYVRSRLKARQKELQQALPDMLDMLVVCVEAGPRPQPGARARGRRDRPREPGDERAAHAGEPRDPGRHRRATRRSRTSPTAPACADMKSLVGMLIQTDRFGTSVADALRMHADTHAHQAPPARRGGRGQDHDQAGLPAGASASSRRCSWWCWARR